MTDTAPNPAAAAPLTPLASPGGVPAPPPEQVAATQADDRLATFRREVGDLKVTGGAANPERTGARLGIALVVIGLVGAAVCWYSAYNAGHLRGDPADDHRRRRVRRRGDRRRRCVDAQLDDPVLPLLADPPRVRAAGADRAAGRGAAGADGPAHRHDPRERPVCDAASRR